ncbi:hypothetical protein AVEN_131871-1 [Araneus ventricosus]|uniref:DUF4817 domain-containing protein n=1 Tax=Araneus ventricosus TaxID=182803 RepID=A0A4Y2JTQ1_ARAVE|nr:hypothetical protein AVEN_131871-1 [Araneus ventricosus]
MPLEKKERALLMKLFYRNGSNLSTAPLVYQRLKDLRKGAMSGQAALKKIITKFQGIRELSVLRGRGQKRISSETAEEVALTMVERVSDS